MPRVEEQDLSRVEKHLVILAIEKKVAGAQQALAHRAKADEIERAIAVQFNVDTQPINAAHGIAEGVNVLFDMRPNGDTMFLSFSPAGLGLVADAPTPGSEGPIDPLT